MAENTKRYMTLVQIFCFSQGDIQSSTILLHLSHWFYHPTLGRIPTQWQSTSPFLQIHIFNYGSSGMSNTGWVAQILIEA